MANLSDIIAYILDCYPHKQELSNARVTKMVYLADWLHALNYDSQLSTIEWYFDNYGPFVWDIYRAVESDPHRFAIENTANMYGNQKTVFSLVEPKGESPLAASQKEIIDQVVDLTSKMNWDRFIRLVYSTHPIVTSPRYSQLDIIGKAEEFRAKQGK